MAGRVTMLPFSNLYERYHFVQGTSPQRISMFQNGSHLSCNLTPVTDTMQPLPYLPYSLPPVPLSLSLSPTPTPTLPHPIWVFTPKLPLVSSTMEIYP